jgi:hypothetical protein
MGVEARRRAERNSSWNAVANRVMGEARRLAEARLAA